MEDQEKMEDILKGTHDLYGKILDCINQGDYTPTIIASACTNIFINICKANMVDPENFNERISSISEVYKKEFDLSQIEEEEDE